MDINQIAFGIKGEADGAVKSLSSLISKLDLLDVAFSRVKASGQSVISILSGISTAAAGISGGLNSTSGAAKTVSTAMGTVTATTKKSTEALGTATSRSATFGNAIHALTSRTEKSHASMSKFIQRITQLTFIIYIARRAFSAFGTGIASSIAYVENLNLFMVALGENTTRATSFIKEMAASLYLDEAQLTRVQGLFYQISESLGLSSEKAYVLSENFTKLAYDLASFYNITVDSAITKLQAGLVGETEPLRRIGIIITENNLAETARNLGIRKSIRNMTEQEKIQLRYITALQQTKNAQGDLARTMQQPENMLRILKEQFSVLMRELGNVAIPILKKMLPEVIGMTVALGNLAKSWAASLGYDAPVIRDDLGGYVKTVADKSGDIEKTTDKTAKNLAKVLKYTKETSTSMTGIDELNILSSSSQVSGVDSLFPADDLADATDSINLALEDYNNNMDKSAGVFSDIVEKWQTRFTKLGTALKGVFSDTKIAINNLWNALTGKETDQTTTLNRVRDTLDIIDSILSGIVIGITTTYNNFKLLWENILKPILEAIAPDWVQSFINGNLQTTVAKITELFLLWKTVQFGVGVVASLASLLKLGSNVPLLITLFTAMAGIKIAFDISEAIDTGDFEALGNTLKNAILTGLAIAGITGSVKAGVIAFNIVAIFDLDLGEGWNNLLTSGVDKVFEGLKNVDANFKDSGVGKALGTFDLVGALIDLGTIIKNAFSSSPKTGIGATPKGYANGGKPQKGSLFIAGEAGAELVGDFGNGTSVINEKQMESMGIPMYAGGTSNRSPAENAIAGGGLSKETIATLKNSGRQSAVTSAVDKPLNALINTIKKLDFQLSSGDMAFVKMTEDFDRYGKTIKDTFNEFKDRAVSFWEGLKDSSTLGGFIKILGSTGKAISKIGEGFATVLAKAYIAFKDTGVSQIFSSASSDGGSTAQQQEVAGGVISASLGDSALGMVFNVMQSIADGSVGAFITSLPMFFEAGMDMILNLIDGVIAALPDIMAAISDVIEKIVNILTNKESLNSIINGLVKMVAVIITALPDIIAALVDAIPDIIITLIEVFIDNLPLFLKLGLAIGVAILEGIANLLIGGVNLIIGLINALIPGTSWDIKKLESADFSSWMPTFAEGGYPTQGQMFIAREAGAELVGNIGGSTGVMNNEQIVQAVSNGVYNAVSQAMKEQGTKETVINLDGRKVSLGIAQANKNRGLSFGTGGY